MKPMMAGGAANFKSKGLLEISPRTITTEMSDTSTKIGHTRVLAKVLTVYYSSTKLLG